jgi:1-acyl-sn-glycerol-3-phosphate acyltransferase
MKLPDLWRATRQWLPFSVRTVAYGTLSIALGPLTRDHRASLWAMQRWCRSNIRGLNIVVEASGLENVPATGAFVYCTNHQSIVDIIVLGAVLPGDYKWAVKRSLMRIPFLGWHLTIAGHVPVDRGAGARAAADAVRRFEHVLSDGKPLLVFPEGTRSQDGLMRSFKSGCFYAAVRAGAPIVPVALHGTHRLMKRGAHDIGDERVRPVRVNVGPPIYPRLEGNEDARMTDLRDRTYDAVADLLESIGGRTKARGRPQAELLQVAPTA